MSYQKPISREDPAAVEKLEQRLAECERFQIKMRDVNAYFRKNGTLTGCVLLTKEEVSELTENMRRRYPLQTQPYPPYMLTNNSAEVRRLRKRVEELSAEHEAGYVGWAFEGGTVEANKELCRLQIFFDEKPSEEKRNALKMNGFHWSPNAGAWQRQLNGNAIHAAGRVAFLKPLDGRTPYEHQPKREKADRGDGAR